MLHRLSLLLLLCVTGSATAGIAVGEPMPAWQAHDAQGAPFEFVSGARERPVVVVFWATYCHYCKQLMTELSKLTDEMGAKRPDVYAVAVYEHPGADPIAALRQRGHDFTPVLEADAVAQRFGVQGTPALYFVDRSGKVRYHRMGVAQPGQVAEELRTLLDEDALSRH
ncbi:MAG: TlpA family protein disulfide reductase [Xanthomonadales bacterium]|nr:TlpA family protein disulfide reductase [Xanthomonadales bacterium]